MLHVLSFFALLVLTGCQTTGGGKTPPPWFTAYHNDGSVEAVYPKAQYIAQIGTGESREAARVNASADISRYFSLQVEGSAAGGESFVETNGSVQAERRLDRKTVERFNTELHALRYSEPWQNRKEKQWEIVAYIDRDEGWAVYQPNAKSQADALISLVTMAETEKEPFNAALRYGIAASYAESEEFNTVRDFSQALHPVKAEALFTEADAARGELVNKQFAAIEKSSIYVECPQDYNGMIYQAMVKALGASGFGVAQNRAAAAFCVVLVEEGMQKQENGFLFYPALTATISGKAGPLFSFKITGDRQGALNADLAKRRAYTALASALEASFPVELQKRQAALVRE
jgi:hypothetical protein